MTRTLITEGTSGDVRQHLDAYARDELSGTELVERLVTFPYFVRRPPGKFMSDEFCAFIVDAEARVDDFSWVHRWAWHGRIPRHLYLDVCSRLGSSPLPDPSTVEMRPVPAVT